MRTGTSERHFTRREALAGATAGAVAVGFHVPPALGRGSSHDVDVAIVGAGAAGIGAGAAVRAAGKRYVILEALDRIGGRTSTTTFPGTRIRWDLGAQWYHFVTPNFDRPGHTNNPLFDIAVRKHFKVFPDDGPRVLCLAPKPQVDMLNTDLPVTLAAMATDAIGVGAGASLGLTKDVSVAAATAELKSQPYYQLVGGLINLAVGGFTQLSSEDLFDEIQGGALLPPIVPSYDNWLTPPGLGTLVVSLARGLKIRTRTPVRTIHWRDKETVVLETPRGNLVARTVIVTVPIGALAGGTLAFKPALPGRYQHAIHNQLEMGHTAKIALLYANNFVFPAPQANSFAIPNIDSPQTSFAQVRAFGHKNFAIVVANPDNVVELERKGQLVDYARQQIRTMFGPSADRAFRQGMATTWNTNKYFRGAFSRAVPGGVPGRRQLGAPLANRFGKDQVFFAGEAVSLVQHSSAPGAWTTGHQAAAKALKSLMR